MLGWDQSQARTWDAACRHTALAALAQLRHAAIRNALYGDITLPAPADGPGIPENGEDDHVDEADLLIPLGDAPVPARSGAAVPAPDRADQAIGRRDRPADPPRSSGPRWADHPHPARLRAALVRPAAPPPGRRPLAPPQRPPAPPPDPRQSKGGDPT